jgi:glycosyltransferase involved in cell wall biosynthesis
MGDIASFEVSVVIPVFNGALSVTEVVDRIGRALIDRTHEIVLVDDGSVDDSVRTCRRLANRESAHIRFIELSRNFGEHSAVLAGLARTRGKFVAVLDDDGQNPPEELPRMLAELQRGDFDVIYGKYSERQHHWFRRLGSSFNDRIANVMLRKPPELYLSSFKVMNRFIVDEIIKYSGPYPYIDGLICRTSNRLGQVEVQHAARIAGRSNYSLVRLVRLWLNMFLGFSIVPLRVASVAGLLTAASSLMWLLAIIVDKLMINPNVTVGVPTVLACICLFSGVQLMVLGMLGEYLGRVHLSTNGQPQYVVRSSTDGDP